MKKVLEREIRRVSAQSEHSALECEYRNSLFEEFWEGEGALVESVIQNIKD